MRTIKFLLNGHGGWTIKDGFCRVPANSWVIFYHQIHRMLNIGTIKNIIKKDLSRDSSLDNFDSINDQFTQIPNMTLYPNREEDFADDIQLKALNTQHDSPFIFVDFKESRKLSEIMQMVCKECETMDEDLYIEFHWGACRMTNLKSTGGKFYGMNADLEQPNADGSFDVYNQDQGIFEAIQFRDPFYKPIEKLCPSFPRPTPRPRSAPQPRVSRQQPSALTASETITRPTPIPRSRSTASAIDVIQSAPPVPAPRRRNLSPGTPVAAPRRK